MNGPNKEITGNIIWILKFKLLDRNVEPMCRGKQYQKQGGRKGWFCRAEMGGGKAKGKKSQNEEYSQQCFMNWKRISYFLIYQFTYFKCAQKEMIGVWVTQVYPFSNYIYMHFSRYVFYLKNDRPLLPCEMQGEGTCYEPGRASHQRDRAGALLLDFQSS